MAGSHDATGRQRAPLTVELKPVETLVARTELVAMGRFVCHSSHPLFRDSGPCSNHTIVFPRTVTAVHRQDGVDYVADPTTVLFYNQNQQYTRAKVSEVDECDWFVVADEILLDVLDRIGSRADPSRPFSAPFVSTDPDLYLAQRRLFDRVGTGEEVDALGIDETVIRILECVLRKVPSQGGDRGTKHARAAAERVDAVKREVAARLSESISLNDLARVAECSTFELCRSFREVTGMRITEYRNALRTRVALARLRDGGSDLARLALDLGFSSHSHFTAQFRRAFAIPPSVWRANV